MDNFFNDVEAGIRTGFLDYSNACKDEFLPQLVVNDKSKGKKVLTTLRKELSQCKEFWLCVAFVTKGGVATIINALKELEESKITGKILVSQYLNFTQPEALRTLLKFSNVELRISVQGSLHAKQYLFKKNEGYSMIMGSSNLTDRALCVNKEWNLKLTATDDSALVAAILDEFNREFDHASPVTENLLVSYESLYLAQKRLQVENRIILRKEQGPIVKPNSMQVEALVNLQFLRSQGKLRALLISATATGKTYLSAFDVKKTAARKCLFLVHRFNIAKAALDSYGKIFGDSRTLGMYSGERKEIEADFLFATIQTISNDNHLHQFNKDHFDYIVIDETHRSGAPSYQKILAYFEPKFLLGMTATPERTDGFNIFQQFDYNIAYEIRLQRALEEEMLCTFHYYGVTDVIVDERTLKEEMPFNLLVSEERIAKIIEKAQFYGCDNGDVRGLIFCSSVLESEGLSNALNSRGYRTVALSAKNSEEERAYAIQRLESDDLTERLHYIFTVDIFNEGIDIPRVNQIILLRPTQSAIIFVQQLGRGLRKASNKDYLTVIDFIGNYNNNYLVPIALYGDTSYNKDSLRKLMTSDSSLIPGASTVNFDKIARERIFKSIDTANLSPRKDLVKDYELLKFEIGRIPMMVDFIEHGARDPFQYVEYARSYFNFSAQCEDSLQNLLSVKEIKLLELFSNYIADAKRIEEVIILFELLEKGKMDMAAIKKIVLDKYQVDVSDATIDSCINNINFEFINVPQQIVGVEATVIRLQKEFINSLKNEVFKVYLTDALLYAQITYDKKFDRGKYIHGFILYQKYSRRDACRILNWERNESSTMYGYRIKNNTCPIFVNYHKEENITSTTKYNDGFVNNYEFEWMSRAGAKLETKEIVEIKNYQDGLRLSLFIKKSNDEGVDFYYMGEVIPTKFEQTTILGKENKPVPIVKVNFIMEHPVESTIYEYLVQE